MFTKTFFIETNDDKVMPPAYIIYENISQTHPNSACIIFQIKLIKFSLPDTSKGGDPVPKRIP